jgi:DNA-directed RNA polymerase specialized sigma24 family protein
MSHEGDALREQLNLLHKCLLSTGGGAMREQLAACLLPRVALSVRARLPGVGAEILSDATSDAILRYLQRPSIYQPSRSRLDTFLTTIATRLAIDALRKEARLRAVETALDSDIAEVAGAGACCFDAVAVSSEVICRTHGERLFLEARLDGERGARTLASLLGGADLPPEEQRRLVKRTTERLRMRAQRVTRLAIG